MKVKTALLVIDVQKFFFEMLDTITLSNILKLLSQFSKNQTDSIIILTQHGHPESELNSNSTNQLVRKWGVEGSIKRGSKDWEFIPQLQSYADDDNDDIKGRKYIVQKNTYDAFINTDLSKILEENEVIKIIICGVMTDCCVDTTGRSSFNRGFETVVVGDACASANNTQHQAGLKGFGFAFGEILSTAEVLKKL